MDTDPESGAAPGLSGLGRRLDVHVLPSMEMDTWWFRPRGDVLRRAVLDDDSVAGGGPRPVLCDFGADGTMRASRAWPTLPHHDRVYDGDGDGDDGDGAERLLLTVYRTSALTFRPGREIGIFPTSRQPLPLPVPGGTLESPVVSPDWLVRALREHHRSRVDRPITPSRHRWQHAIHSCSVTEDGHELWFTMRSYRDEVLAGFDVEEGPDRVTVRAWLAFGPDGPTSFGQGPVATMPDGRRLGRMSRKGAGRGWGKVVLLRSPLGARPVVDVAAPDPHGALAARRAWRSERG